MSSWKDEQVLIVGGGIGGLTAALALARQGIPSQLIAPSSRKSAPASSSAPTCFGCSSGSG
jgi:2-polyprenyl-6-methoxyphenol hydroxylase-like FAD-dependent oxidoreductase